LKTIERIYYTTIHVRTSTKQHYLSKT